MGAPKGHIPYKGCETGGRPRDYTEAELDQLADDYLAWMEDPEKVWMKDFCLERGIEPHRMQIWAERSEKFRSSVLKAKHLQESRLVIGGLKNKFNAQIVKFCLANCHAWRERSETLISGSTPNPLSFVLQTVEGSSKDLVTDC